jgi:ElaA protein
MFGAMESTDGAPPAAPAAPWRWQWSRFADLGVDALYEVLAARQQVFAVEQHCAFQDADGLDRHAWHLMAWVDGGGEQPSLAGYLRAIDPGRKFDEPAIGRVLTLPPHRGSGFGRVLMREGIARTLGTWPGRAIRIAAQQRLEAFYASLGFRAAGAPYDEDGIPHVDMLYAAASVATR